MKEKWSHENQTCQSSQRSLRVDSSPAPQARGSAGSDWSACYQTDQH
jgi:hypothetical protein